MRKLKSKSTTGVGLDDFWSALRRNIDVAEAAEPAVEAIVSVEDSLPWPEFPTFVGDIRAFLSKEHEATGVLLTAEKDPEIERTTLVLLFRLDDYSDVGTVLKAVSDRFSQKLAKFRQFFLVAPDFLGGNEHV